MQENQQVVCLSDGGEDVRQVQASLHPNSEHGIDWFHLTMRLTVLPPQTQALQGERPDEGVAASIPIESVQPRLWHGHVDEALDRIDCLFIDGDLIADHPTRRTSWRWGSRTGGPPSGTTGDRSPTTENRTGRGRRSARRRWSRRSIRW
jgi:hypothetical protein